MLNQEKIKDCITPAEMRKEIERLAAFNPTVYHAYTMELSELDTLTIIAYYSLSSVQSLLEENTRLLKTSTQHYFLRG